MERKKSNISNVKIGDHWSRISNGVVTQVTPSGLEITNEEGNSWQIGSTIVEDEFYFHNQHSQEIKVTRTELAELFINHPRMIMTANYYKQVKEKDLNEQFFELYANKGGKLLSEVDYKKRVKELTKIALKGEERTISGRHEGALDDFGRMHFTDVQADWNKEKDYDTRHRLVDPRTLQWVIVANVKYIVK